MDAAGARRGGALFWPAFASTAAWAERALFPAPLSPLLLSCSRASGRLRCWSTPPSAACKSSPPCWAARCVERGGSQSARLAALMQSIPPSSARPSNTAPLTTPSRPSSSPNRLLQAACNVLAAVGAGIACGVPLKAVVAGIEAVDIVPGRCEIIDEGQPFSVVVSVDEQLLLRVGGWSSVELLSGCCEARRGAGSSGCQTVPLLNTPTRPALPRCSSPMRRSTAPARPSSWAGCWTTSRTRAPSACSSCLAAPAPPARSSAPP